MTRDEEDLYARHQMLAALVSVLVHDLRNPLHSAALLVEAMGARSADIEVLREKLRSQLAKLDGLISETAPCAKELALEPRLEVTAVDDLIRAVVDGYPALGDQQATFDPPPASTLQVYVDRRIVTRAAQEIAAIIADFQGRAEKTPLRVRLTIDEPEKDVVRLCLGELEGAEAELLVKAPFAIAGGGVRLAVARSLGQRGGAMVRLEQGADGVARFAFFLRKPN